MIKRMTDRELARFFANKKIATMQELKHALVTEVDMTVYRALKRLSYRTSYSHGGRYYALNRTIKFGENGLWSTNSVWFSRSGTLAATLERRVTTSELGYFADELEGQLHVGVRETLLRLIQKDRLRRQRMGRSYLYCSSITSVRRRQLVAREHHLQNWATPHCRCSAVPMRSLMRSKPLLCCSLHCSTSGNDGYSPVWKRFSLDAAQTGGLPICLASIVRLLPKDVANCSTKISTSIVSERKVLVARAWKKNAGSHRGDQAADEVRNRW